MAPSVHLVAGARPNFMKLAPVLVALDRRGGIRCHVVHTGQHYDALLSDVFLAELGIPGPDVHLGVGSGPHGAQTARVLERYEAHLQAEAPDAVVVFGDVNSTVACALAAAKLAIPVAHVEAGLRSFDRTMPEEVNRVLTDAISDLLLVTEPAGVENLRREGVAASKIALVGNTMVDTLLRFLPEARAARRSEALGLADAPYGLVTLHRPSNVDDPATLRQRVRVLEDVAARLPLLFPVHPRTLAAGERAGLELGEGTSRGGLHFQGPQSYRDHLSLMAGACVVLTDSGGMQVEAAAVGVPCVLLRDTTEHALTVAAGATRLTGSDPVAVRAAVTDALEGRWSVRDDVPLADGRAGERVATAIAEWLG